MTQLTADGRERFGFALSHVDTRGPVIEFDENRRMSTPLSFKSTLRTVKQLGTFYDYFGAITARFETLCVLGTAVPTAECVNDDTSSSDKGVRRFCQRLCPRENEQDIGTHHKFAD